MKKVLTLVGLTAVLLVGCSGEETPRAIEAPQKAAEFEILSKTSVDGYNVRIIKQRETGCKYIMATGSGTEIEPLLGTDSKIVCDKQ